VSKEVEQFLWDKGYAYDETEDEDPDDEDEE
jgi:hypothetical protein